MLVEVVLIIITRRFAVRHSVRGIYAMVLIDLIEQTCLRIEEVEVLLHIEYPLRWCFTIIRIIVCRTFVYVINVTILQVYISAQALSKFVAYLAINIAVILLTLIEVILMIGQQLVNFLRILYPLYESEVIAYVTVEATTNRSTKVALIVVVERTNHTIEIVVHQLLTD